MINTIKEYVLYKKSVQANAYFFLQSNEKTLGVLMALIYDFYPDIDELKQSLLNLSKQVFCSKSVAIGCEKGTVVLSSAYSDFADDYRDFVATVPQLLKIVDAWERLYNQGPSYILVCKNMDGLIIIKAVDNVQDILNLPYNAIQANKTME